MLQPIVSGVSAAIAGRGNWRASMLPAAVAAIPFNTVRRRNM
jgi:hypothetical protein